MLDAETSSWREDEWMERIVFALNVIAFFLILYGTIKLFYKNRDMSKLHEELVDINARFQKVVGEREKLNEEFLEINKQYREVVNTLKKRTEASED